MIEEEDNPEYLALHEIDDREKSTCEYVLDHFIVRYLSIIGAIAVFVYLLMDSGHPQQVLSMAIWPTSCLSKGPDSEPYGVLVNIDGVDYMLLLDTGSSNLIVASDSCTSCSVSPKLPDSLDDGLIFNISYGSGFVVNRLNKRAVKIGSDSILADVGVIISQAAGTSEGFNFFALEGSKCHNTYAGILGLAYQSQAAGPWVDGHKNGTTVPPLDAALEIKGGALKNMFTIEICPSYPENCTPRKSNTSWTPTEKCAKTRVGNFFVGGYNTGRLKEPLQYLAHTDQIHYNIQLLDVEVCGVNGCLNVTFPDKIDGATEDDCEMSQHTRRNGEDDSHVDYCYFTVIDSGTHRIYMNTVGNTLALIHAMMEMELVHAKHQVNRYTWERFFFDKTPLPGASVHKNASVSFYFKADNGPTNIRVPVKAKYIFRQTDGGLIQDGIQGDLSVISAFSRAKFPIIMGDLFMRGKAFVFDRSRKRIGFAHVSQHVCQQPSFDFDIFGEDALPTPGNGCKRGTSSGGGCS